jgi:hypothetical protein
MTKIYIFDEALGLCRKYMERFGATRKCVWDAYEKEKVAKEDLEVFPNHEHYVCNCEMLHTCMFVETMIFLLGHCYNLYANFAINYQLGFKSNLINVLTTLLILKY